MNYFCHTLIIIFKLNNTMDDIIKACSLKGLSHDDIVKFKNAEMEYTCVDNWGRGRRFVTYDDLAAVKSLDGAFANNGLIKSFRSVQYFKNVRELTAGEFMGCSSMTEIVLPKNLKVIGDRAFAFCVSLPEIRIPDGVEEIGAFAFHGCESLREVTIPASVRRIGAHLFAMCESLVKVNFEGRIEDIEIYTPGMSSCGKAPLFTACPNPVEVVDSDGVHNLR